MSDPTKLNRGDRNLGVGAIMPVAQVQGDQTYERLCVACGREPSDFSHPAHIVPQKLCGRCQHPDCVVPLCKACHAAYDHREGSQDECKLLQYMIDFGAIEQRLFERDFEGFDSIDDLPDDWRGELWCDARDELMAHVASPPAKFSEMLDLVYEKYRGILQHAMDHDHVRYEDLRTALTGGTWDALAKRIGFEDRKRFGLKRSTTGLDKSTQLKSTGGLNRNSGSNKDTDISEKGGQDD